MGARRLDPALLQEQALATDLRELSFEELVQAARQPSPPDRRRPCNVCQGQLGAVVDVGELWRGNTFVVAQRADEQRLELRQYPSTLHGDDFDGLPPLDAITLFDRLRRVEEFLLTRAGSDHEPSGEGRRGFVTVTRRRRRAGHGFQRIRLYRHAPPILVAERRRTDARGGSRPALLETTQPTDLVLGEFRGGVTAVLTPRPERLEIVLYFRPAATGSLCDLDGDRLWGLAQALREVTGALRLELSVLGRPGCYRWILHGGPDQEVHLRVATERRTTEQDDPARWSARLRDHLGLQ